MSSRAVVGVAPALSVPPGVADKRQALLINLLFCPWVLMGGGAESRDGEPLPPHPQLLHDPWLRKPWVPPAGPYLSMGAFLEEF